MSAFDVISMNMKENYNYLATWRDLWRDVISMNMKENYNFYEFPAGKPTILMVG